MQRRPVYARGMSSTVWLTISQIPVWTGLALMIAVAPPVHSGVPAP